ncbi:ABC transporter permease [Nocardia goodfellowii]|uniref:ABC-2 type transport system permease protein n=1 Tax=Nocardia goodfellowii TaxID=882446 RepID=A0ABS4QIS1_9NOCA|nr:polyketide antibiotic transporter [Nocardia goodfellowii]MBP2191611.1 ABC-2 type transport system permease protein [Nocardia goodfellowii]
MTAAARPEPLNTSTPGRALVWLTGRLMLRGTVLVALAVSMMSAVVAAQYQAVFADTLDAGALGALAENPAVRILFGAPQALDNAGGFTVWRTGTPVLVLCGAWALLAATRITRGEEDAGRWDLLLGGRARLRALVFRAAAALTLAAVLIAVAVGGGLFVVGTDPAGALLHALCVFGSTVAFANLGLLAAQVLPTRSAATGLASAVLGVALLLRMLADGVSFLAWAAWLTPFGLAARTAPYADNRVLPVLVLLCLAVAPGAVALVAARHRDLGGGLIVMTGARRARTRLLGSIPGFAVRRALVPTLGWMVGIATYFLLIGALIASILEFFGENPRFAEVAAAAGFGLGSPSGFAAAMFAVLAMPAGGYAAIRVAAMGADERARRWTVLHALPVSRYHWAATEFVVTAAGSAILLGTAATAMWLGAVLTGAPLGLGQALAGAFNVFPVALLSLGAGVLALGWRPAAIGVIGAIPAIGGFFIDVMAQSVGAPAWVREISPFAHLAAVPVTAPDWFSGAMMIAIAAAVTVLGLYGYARRDLDG